MEIKGTSWIIGQKTHLSLLLGVSLGVQAQQASQSGLHFNHIDHSDTEDYKGEQGASKSSWEYYFQSTDTNSWEISGKGSDPCMVARVKQAERHAHGVVTVVCPNQVRPYISNTFTLRTGEQDYFQLQLNRWFINLETMEKDAQKLRFERALNLIKKWDFNQSLPLVDGKLADGDTIFSLFTQSEQQPQVLSIYDDDAYVDQFALLQAIQFLEAATEIPFLEAVTEQSRIDTCYQRNPSGAIQIGGENGQWPSTYFCDPMNYKTGYPEIQSRFLRAFNGTYVEYQAILNKWEAWGKAHYD
ncbi:MAG: hypothetical protein ACFB10_26795 [Salibacteraceae bacterium]